MSGADLLAKQIEDVKRDALNRLREIAFLVENIREKIDKGRCINDLGEFQGVVNLADCRVATLASLIKLRDDCEKADALSGVVEKK